MARKVEIIPPKKQSEKKDQQRKPRVCAYARVSTGSEEQATSQTYQEEYWKEKLDRPEYDFIGVFSDTAISGTTDKRPGFQRMIKMALRGEIDTIWTKNISRFSRNVFDLLKYTKLLEEAGVNVIFDETRIEGDEKGLSLRSANGKIMLLVLASVAEMEVQNTSDHIKHTLHAKMSRGELVGQPNPYGYDRHGNDLVINEDEAKWVRFIFESYINGLGCKAIARALTEKEDDNTTWEFALVENDTIQMKKLNETEKLRENFSVQKAVMDLYKYFPSDSGSLRSVREIQAESIAYLCSKIIFDRFGIDLDTSDYSFPYIATWAEKPDEIITCLSGAKSTANLMINKIEQEIEKLQIKETESIEYKPEILAKNLTDFAREFAPYEFKENEEYSGCVFDQNYSAISKNGKELIDIKDYLNEIVDEKRNIKMVEQAFKLIESISRYQENHPQISEQSIKHSHRFH